jgi:5-methylcytosine-specific restriction endonuclease McrA
MQVLSRPPSGAPALVLNADFRPLSYYPLSLWPWQETIKAVFLGRVEVVSTYDTLIHSPTFEMRLPSVVALKHYIAQDRPPAFTRFNLFLRDGFACQYCGRAEDLTFDHVIPRSRGGRTTWENIVRPLSERGGARRARPACSRGGCRAARRPTNCKTTVAVSRPVICTKVGWTISIGTSNWRREVGRSPFRTARRF